MRRSILLPLVLAVVAPAVCAAQPPAAVDSVDALLEAMGTPARADVVDDLVGAPGASTSSRGGDLVTALSRAGGTAAIQGLATLLRRGDDTVKSAVLAAVNGHTIRTASLLESVRTVFNSGSLAQRVAAADALGWIGDGTDVRRLVDALSSREAGFAPAAFSALGHLTRAKLALVPALWTSWWATTGARGKDELASALERFDGAVRSGDVAEVRATIDRWGWIDLERVGEDARRWLSSPDARVRAEACSVVESWRLGDLADEVRAALKYALEPMLWARSLSAARALGVPLEGIHPPSSVHDPTFELEAARATSRARRPDTATSDARASGTAAAARDADGSATRPAAVAMPQAATDAGPDWARLELDRAVEAVSARDFATARRILDAVKARAKDGPEAREAEKGEVAIWAVRRVDAAKGSEAAERRADARRSLRGTIWAALFAGY